MVPGRRFAGRRRWPTHDQRASSFTLPRRSLALRTYVAGPPSRKPPGMEGLQSRLDQMPGSGCSDARAAADDSDGSSSPGLHTDARVDGGLERNRPVRPDSDDARPGPVGGPVRARLTGRQVGSDGTGGSRTRTRLPIRVSCVWAKVWTCSCSTRAISAVMCGSFVPRGESKPMTLHPGRLGAWTR